MLIFTTAHITSGLAYQGSGTGGILLIESTLVPGGRGKLVLTGSLGDVISESAELALTWVKSHALALGITSAAGEDPVKGIDVHVSCSSLSLHRSLLIRSSCISPLAP